MVKGLYWQNEALKKNHPSFLLHFVKYTTKATHPPTFQWMRSLLHSDSFICVLMMRSQPRVDGILTIRFWFPSVVLFSGRDLDPAVEGRQNDPVQEENSVQHVTDLWLGESGSTPKSQPQRNHQKNWVPTPNGHGSTGSARTTGLLETQGRRGELW